MLAKILAFFKALLPVKWDTTKVPPAIQAEIDQILGFAKARVEVLRAGHSVAAIRTQLEKDIADVRASAERHVDLLKANAAQAEKEAALVLPTVAQQFGATGATGVTGPVGF